MAEHLQSFVFVSVTPTENIKYLSQILQKVTGLQHMIVSLYVRYLFNKREKSREKSLSVMHRILTV